MYITATTDIIFRFVDNISKCLAGQIDYSILEEYRNLVDYVNENVREICSNYNAKPILIEHIEWT